MMSTQRYSKPGVTSIPERRTTSHLELTIDMLDRYLDRESKIWQQYFEDVNRGIETSIDHEKNQRTNIITALFAFVLPTTLTLVSIGVIDARQAGIMISIAAFGTSIVWLTWTQTRLKQLDKTKAMMDAGSQQMASLWPYLGGTFGSTCISFGASEKQDDNVTRTMIREYYLLSLLLSRAFATWLSRQAGESLVPGLLDLLQKREEVGSKEEEARRLYQKGSLYLRPVVDANRILKQILTEYAGLPQTKGSSNGSATQTA